MGIFSYYLGEMDIPEADRPEYARQALAILRAGGMMSVEQIHLCGKSMYLLFPPEFDEKGEASGYYNYLDNQSWEPWKLSTENGVFWSNKIGGNCFYHTIIAVNILSSLWAKSYGAATVDGRLVKENPISAGSTACWERPIQTGGLHRFGLWKSCCIRRTNVQNITVI